MKKGGESIYVLSTKRPVQDLSALSLFLYGLCLGLENIHVAVLTYVDSQPYRLDIQFSRSALQSLYCGAELCKHGESVPAAAAAGFHQDDRTLRRPSWIITLSFQSLLRSTLSRGLADRPLRKTIWRAPPLSSDSVKTVVRGRLICFVVDLSLWWSRFPFYDGRKSRA